MKQITLIILIILLIGCKHDDNQEIEKLYNLISIDNQFNIENLDIGYLIVPERYDLEGKIYRNSHRLIGDIIDKIDSLKKVKINDFDQQKFNFQIQIDKVENIVKEVNKYNDDWSASYSQGVYSDTLYSKDYLNNLIIGLNKKLKSTGKKRFLNDLSYIKLYLTLIERNIIYTLNREISYKTFNVDYIEPVIIKRKDYIDCFVTAIDNANKNYIVIGKFEKYKIDSNVFYKVIKAYDTIDVINAQAKIENDVFNKGEAILFLTKSDGSRMTRKIK
jgi:hypothetical protein